MIIVKMIKIWLKEDRCARGIRTIKSTERRHVGIVYACSFLSVVVTISCCGQIVVYVELAR
jgi:hypothetical protein